MEGVLHELVVGKLTSAATRQASFAVTLHYLHVVLVHVARSIQPAQGRSGKWLLHVSCDLHVS